MGKEGGVMFNWNIFGIDSVQIKSQIQRTLLFLMLLIILWNPLYTILLLGIAFFVRKNAKYKRYYLVALTIELVVYAGLSGYYPLESYIMESVSDYLLPFPPVRMMASICITIASMLFEWGSVDNFMIEAEKNRQKEIFSPCEELSFDDHSHIFVAGTTGTGKSQMLLKYIHQSIKNNEPVYIISGKRSGDKGSLLECVKTMANIYRRKLYIVSMNEEEKDRVPYNPFKEMKIIEVADALCNASRFSEEHYKKSLSCWIKAICECMKLAEMDFSLPAIVDFMVFDNFRVLVNELLRRKKISEREAISYLDLESTAKEAFGSRARFLNILLGEGKEVVGDSKAICASDVQRENAILFLDMDSFSYTDFTQDIGAFFINDMRHIVARSTDEEKKRIIMDEISTYATKDMDTLFSQSRSFNYQMIVATQSISDLEKVDPTFAETVLENCNQYGILRLNTPKDAEHMSNVIGTKMAVETTRKSTGMHLHYTADGSKKVVNEYKIPPDKIKELKKLELLFYNKDEPDVVKKIKLKYGWEN